MRGTQLRKQGVDVADEQDQRDRSRILDAPARGLSIDPIELHELDAAAGTGDVEACRTPARLGQSVKIQDLTARVPCNRVCVRCVLESEQIAIETDRAIEVGHDRTDVAGAGDRRC